MPCHCLRLNMHFDYCVMIALNLFSPFDDNIAILTFSFLLIDAAAADGLCSVQGAR
jgi:hypothetical protein